jgi:hypothetical protein
MALAKFSLPIYFRLRTHSISERLDAPLSAGLPTAARDSDAQLRLEASNLLLWALRRLWSPEVFLEPLLPRFWDQSLRLIDQYRAWQATVVANAASQPHGHAAPPPAAQNGTSGDSSTNEGQQDSVQVIK